MVTTLPSGTPLQGGRYRVERVLGQGGFGITYLAMHTGFGQKVALKEFFMKELCVRNEETSYVTLGSEASSATVGRFREKFLKEARNLFRLNHKHIVRVLDIFEENGTAYFAMEYAEGGSLSEKVKTVGALPESVATRYILQVAEALAYLHEQKMNHLDVKPANIMLSAKDNAVLIDFGLAKQYDATGSQTSTTPAGISEGYAPMEQYKLGGVAEFTPETDIYALGATFFKLLTGVTPPSAQDVFEDGVPVETLRQHGVSEDAISVIEQAMKPSKKKRTSSVEAFMAALKGKSSDVTPHIPDYAEETKFIAVEAEPKEPVAVEAEPKEPIAVEAEPKEPIAVEAEPKEPIAVEVADGHEYVDLGLSSGTLWATCNVGASKPEEYGDYFAWGETEPKDVYSWKTYKWMEYGYEDQTGCSKYTIPDKNETSCWYRRTSFLGIVTEKEFVGDNKVELGLEDDAAYVNWGKNWRMPSKEQIQELSVECIWTWTERNGVKGYEVKSKKNGRTIFLPAAGSRNVVSLCNVSSCGDYWSLSLHKRGSHLAHYLNFGESRIDSGNGYGGRYYGFSIRPVRAK